MVGTREWGLPGGPGGSERLFAKAWAATSAEPTWLAVLVHGYGEHIGRYEQVARFLCERGAAVYGLDHRGHGRSSGERVLIEDFAEVVDDVHRVVTQARTAYRSLPLVLVGHSLGGLIAARYTQRHPDGVSGLVLSGPVLGRWTVAEELLAATPIPETPIDPATLSRDPSVGAAYVADELVWHGPFKRPTLAAITTELGRITESGRTHLPLLWLHGSQDRLVPVADTLVGITDFAGPDFTARLFPGAQHEVFNETNRAEVLEEVARFAGRFTG
ncbi:alpha/beta hydrolase [Marinactinospora thermotolerans]|uniref:Lysophospholipase, alpha-beta hydrolase superfamily n=1 Tax=Marinactinospora thermotolerans DSM 45154 TaxID=1122192 RepID=A0A1T4KEG4_9ACTN|nr:alpha/beta hydrolase [Marinactinospora thermotolerans]SJZ40745.1 Lysophospholipase, alpha-beta hydrolase superfamily [Marinactinospora thermotolerans DSM 45154]